MFSDIASVVAAAFAGVTLAIGPVKPPSEAPPERSHVVQITQLIVGDGADRVLSQTEVSAIDG